MNTDNIETNVLEVATPKALTEHQQAITDILDGTTPRKHRQNRNTLAAFLRSRNRTFWDARAKGSYAPGHNKVKAQLKLLKSSK